MRMTLFADGVTFLSTSEFLLPVSVPLLKYLPIQPQSLPLARFFARRNVVLGFCLRPDLGPYKQEWYWISVETLRTLSLPELRLHYHRFHVITLHSRENLCGYCGKYYTDNLEQCQYVEGLKTEKVQIPRNNSDLPEQRWTCCDNKLDYERRTMNWFCCVGVHVPLQFTGFAPTLTYWKQIRILLAMKSDAASEIAIPFADGTG